MTAQSLPILLCEPWAFVSKLFFILSTFGLFKTCSDCQPPRRSENASFVHCCYYAHHRRRKEMAHTLDEGKISSTRDDEDIILSVNNPDREKEMSSAREELMRSKMRLSRELSLVFIGTRKRDKVSSFCDDEPPAQNLRSSFLSRRDIRSATWNEFDVLRADFMTEIFEHLPQLPTLLTTRQVCHRWYMLSCSSRSSTSSSLKGQKDVTSQQHIGMCKNTTSLHELKKSTLASIHSITDHSPRLIPRCGCCLVGISRLFAVQRSK